MKTLKTIFSILLAGYILFSMSGLGVFYHFCGCKEKVFTSVLIKDDCCNHSTNDLSCCDETETGTCHSESKHDCDCETKVQVLKVNDVVSSVSKVEVNNTLLYIFLTSFYKEIYSKSSFQQNFIVPASDAPPIWGRKLVISFHSIKIPEAIS